jgi:hypothetical protein
MDTGLFEVLHNPTDVEFNTVKESIDINFDRIIEESVDEERQPWRDYCLIRDPPEVVVHRFGVIHDFHAPTAKHERRAHEHRIADLFGDRHGGGKVGCRTVTWGDEPGGVKNFGEQATFFGEIE